MTKGVYSDFTARLDFENWRGQFFVYGAEIHHSYDVNRFVNWHLWPYWADSKDVEAYTTQHLDAIRLFRSDTPFIDKVFCITCHSALDLETDVAEAGNQGGVATKVHIGSLSCDASLSCITSNAAGANFTADLIDYQGADITVAAAMALTGGAPVQVNAALTALISKMTAQGDANGLFNIANNTATGCSNVELGSGTQDNSAFANTSGYLVTAPPCDGTIAFNNINISMPPIVLWHATGHPNAFTRGGGVKLGWPAIVNQP